MIMIAVDDEKIALEGVLDIIKGVKPDADVLGFRNGREALEYVCSHDDCQIAFLDIEMPDMNGMALARALKIHNPQMNIIFTTGYSEYTREALELHASGYIMKPVTKEKVEKELSDLRHPVCFQDKKRVRIMTFGNFEVFIDEEPVKFQYTKTKEMLAYLVDRNGAMCTNGELMAALWEDEENAKGRISYLKNLRTDLIKTLKKSGCEDIIVRKRGEIGIIPEKIQCDYYEWLNGSAQGINAYRGQYMEQYTWSEITHGNFGAD